MGRREGEQSKGERKHSEGRSLSLLLVARSATNRARSARARALARAEGSALLRHDVFCRFAEGESAALCGAIDEALAETSILFCYVVLVSCTVGVWERSGGRRCGVASCRAGVCAAPARGLPQRCDGGARNLATRNAKRTTVCVQVRSACSFRKRSFRKLAFETICEAGRVQLCSNCTQLPLLPDFSATGRAPLCARLALKI